MDPRRLIDLFSNITTAIRGELNQLLDWGPASGHPGQYQHDVVADKVAVPMLLNEGLGVVSEESGQHSIDRKIIAVIDPIDGSTNASMQLPWYATSLAAVDSYGLLASMVVNHPLGVTYTAIRGKGAWRDGLSITPSSCAELSEAVILANDLPPPLGVSQFRILGAASLDICAVADGTFDGFIDCSAGLASWDYYGALLVCIESGVSVGNLANIVSVANDYYQRQQVVVGATTSLRKDLSKAIN